MKIDDFELMVGPEGPQSLIGAPLPALDEMKIDLAAESIRGKMILVCFFDMEQRPSRRYVTQLAKQAGQLADQGVAVIAVQASAIEATALKQWVEKYKIPFPVAMAPDSLETTQLKWAIGSLPWLVLTDRNHVVRAAGFSPGDLEQKIHANRSTGYLC
jgi:peroxiredoxin